MIEKISRIKDFGVFAETEWHPREWTSFEVGARYDQHIEMYAKAGVDLPALAERLQSDGAKGFVDSWRELLAAIDAKSKTLVLL